MKDAKGHGSDTRGGAAPRNQYGVPMTPRMARAEAMRKTNQAKAAQPSPFAPIMTQRMSGTAPAAHQVGVRAATESAPSQVTIFHQDGEYAVPNSPGGKGHYFTNDKQDAESTARVMHGQGITIKHRSKRWGPEMD